MPRDLFAEAGITPAKQAPRDLFAEAGIAQPSDGPTLSELITGKPKQVTGNDLMAQELANISGLKKFAYGAGKGFGDFGLGLEQAVSQLKDKLGVGVAAIPVVGNALLGASLNARPAAQIQQEIDERKAISAPLLKTGSGLAGNIAGAAAAAAPAAFIPGANTAAGAGLIGAVQGALAPVASDESRLVNTALGGAGGVVGQQVGKGIGTAANALAQRLQAARTAQNAVQQATLQGSREAGYVVPPSMAEAGIPARLAEGLSGKYKTNQMAGIKNQEVTDRLARIALGVDENVPLTSDVLNGIRQQAVQTGYEPLRNAGVMATDATYNDALNAISKQFKGSTASFPGAPSNGVDDMLNVLKVKNFDTGDAIDQIRILRDTADSAFRQGNNQLGKASKQAATALEDQVERNLSNAGQQGADMLSAFRDARKQIAKTFSVQKALNDATAQVDAAKLATQFKAGKPLTDELQQIGKFAAAYPDVARIPKSGNANPLTIFDFGAGGVGLGSGNPLLAMLPLARVGARKAILSNPVQNRLAQPATMGLLEQMSNQVKQLPPQYAGLLGASLLPATQQ